MNVNDLFEKLSVGPLSNVHVGGDGDGFIDERKQPQIISAANDALVKLFTRFCLMEKDLILQMHMGVTNYHLLYKFAKSNEASTEPLHRRYILDLPQEPFTEDVAKILAVNNSDGRPLPLDDRESPWSVFTRQAKMLTVPRPNIGNALSVHYQALHPKLTLDDLDAEIYLPDVLHEALLAYISFQFFSSMDTETSNAKAQEHLANFNGICTEATDRDLVTSDPVGTTNVRFDMRGFR